MAPDFQEIRNGMIGFSLYFVVAFANSHVPSSRGGRKRKHRCSTVARESPRSLPHPSVRVLVRFFFFVIFLAQLACSMHAILLVFFFKLRRSKRPRQQAYRAS